ncbi:hypothetical protein ACIF80_12040 [Streptomyces sp. NPDC085927]|uniref:hypothetical protein n=1 Tax=Streptomyces sp. NPDC085927 TaxID=3365738 RepID=UPI0037D78109
MQLVHVRVRLAVDFPTPERLTMILLSHARPPDQIQHISIHPDTGRDLTVGVYVIADSLLEAEGMARAVVARAVEREYELRGARLTGWSAALVPEFYNGLCDARGGGGRSMQGPDQEAGQA